MRNKPTVSKLLISAAELSSVLDSGSTDVLIFDCRFNLTDPEQGYQLYLAGHIPAAVYAHLDQNLAARITSTSGRHPLPRPQEFVSWLEGCGLQDGMQVVVYDNGPGAFAARLWWMLRWVGFDTVRLLDGGLQSWSNQGGLLETSTGNARAAGMLTLCFDDDQWLTTTQLEECRSEVTLIDARNEERFAGDNEPIDPVAGHIPDALNAAFEANLDATGCFLPTEMLRQRFSALIGKDRGDYADVVHMCGSGVTACHNLMAMELAGMPGSRLYVGSWSEWIRDADRPIATGRQPLILCPR